VTTIRSVLVANRGEIARRVFRTCRQRGIATVAVFSDADADAPFVREADTAVRLPGVSPTDTYLRIDPVIDAAERAGADAIHPGYGFLSERADFARAVQAAGLTWIGPPPTSIDAMGSKIEAKQMMRAAGVPVLDQLDPASVTDADLPVLIKASSGGGGRGMRVVRSLDDLPAELELAAAEAASAFGDATVFCEPYLATGRHIEVQVMADGHGNVWAVGERECSIQRRHQKVVEEAPSPLVERIDGMRDRLFAASIAASSAIDYTGAGTVEFLADDDGRFFFLEMNTRLQVEHPVTEATTGLDRVGLQLDVACGKPLPPTQPESNGHAIEVRLYAEDPAKDWQPQSGTLVAFDVPSGPGIRLDSGVESGSTVGIHYDPMLAKVIAWAPERNDAAHHLADVLARSHVHGLVTNRDLLVRTLRHPDFLSGAIDTAFFDRIGLDELAAPLAGADARHASALAATFALAADNRRRAPVLGGLPSGWRNVPSQPQHKAFAAGDEVIDVRYRSGRGGLDVDGVENVTLVSATPERVVLDLGGLRRTFEVAFDDETIWVDSPLGPVTLRRVDRFPDVTSHAAPGSLLAPMPGLVVRLAAAVGDEVEAGRPLLWLEAMKMQHEVRAPVGGIVVELSVHEGQQVDVDTVLAVVQAPEHEEP
jgi:propionyl-CoA carboxylase alpha chain